MFRRPTLRGLFRVLVSSASGVFVAGVLATSWIAVLNLRSEDGPDIAPALLALALVLPVALTLLPFQAVVEVVAARTRRVPWWIVETLAIAGGLAAAVILCAFLLERPSKEPAKVAVLLGLALSQGLVTLSCMRVLAPRRARS